MRQSVLQLFRYAIVGFFSNGVGFLLYLFLTYMGVGSKLSMSVLYMIGVLQTFIFNKKWTFSYQGKHNRTLFRYIVIYGAGYLINLYALSLFVDRFGYSHAWVQGVMIIVIALLLFVFQKIWVFRVYE